MANFANPFNPGMQYHDDDGSPLNGGFLYFYEAGSSTPKTTWADGAMQVPNDNPVVLDSTGRATIFVQGLYKWSLTDSDGVEKASGDDNKFEVITGVAAELLDDTSKANMRSTLGLGSAAVLDTGTGANKVVKFNATAKYPGNDGSLITNINAAVSLPLPYNHISGLKFTRLNATTFSITAGEARDTTDGFNMSLSSTITKSLSGWAEGTNEGSLDIGSLSPSSWLHIFIIGKSDGTGDIAISAEGSLAVNPTNLGNFDYYKYIGVSILLDDDSEITNIVQDGDSLLFNDPVEDRNAAGDGNIDASPATTQLLTVPPDIKVDAIITVTAGTNGVAGSVYFSSPDVSDEAPHEFTDPPFSQLLVPIADGTRYSSGQFEVRTNTSQQIRIRPSQDAYAVDICTLGWRYQKNR